VIGSVECVLQIGFRGLTPPVGVAAPMPADADSADTIPVWFNSRPAQISLYPAVVLFDEGTEPPDYVFVGDDLGTRWKLKDYKVRIEVYGRSKEEAEWLGERVEQVMESRFAVRHIVSLTGGEADGVSIYDRGGEVYEQEAERTPDGQIAVRGLSYWRVEVKRQLDTYLLDTGP
jgi:hypothetical protein